MSANHATIPKKRRPRHLDDGGDVGSGVRHGFQSGLNSICIATPSPHVLDLASLQAAAPGHRKKRPRFTTIKRAQLPAFEEQAMRAVAARRAGEHYLTCLST